MSSFVSLKYISYVNYISMKLENKRKDSYDGMP